MVVSKALLKNGRYIEAYITRDGDHYLFCTGKPSDRCCMARKCDDYAAALDVARRWIEDYGHTFRHPLRIVEYEILSVKW